MEREKEHLLNRTIICKAIANIHLFKERDRSGLCSYGKLLKELNIFNSREFEIFSSIIHQHINFKSYLVILDFFKDPRSKADFRSNEECYFWKPYNYKPRLDYLHYLLEKYI